MIQMKKRSLIISALPVSSMKVVRYWVVNMELQLFFMAQGLRSMVQDFNAQPSHLIPRT